MAGRLLIGEKKPVNVYGRHAVRQLGRGEVVAGSILGADGDRHRIPAELVSRGSGTEQEAIPEPESAQIACATAPKPYVAFTVTVGFDTSIGIGKRPVRAVTSLEVQRVDARHVEGECGVAVGRGCRRGCR